MGRHKTFDGKLVSIGAKVTEDQMRDIKDMVTKLGMNSRSDLFRVALTEYIRMHTENIGYSDSITNGEESSEQIRLNICTAYKELEISLNSAITELKNLGECYQPVCPITCSIIECSEESCDGELKKAKS